jgi:hypothetical protein
MMALDDAGIEAVIDKKGKIVVNKRDLKKAEKALKKSFRKGGAPELVGEEVELTEEFKEKDFDALKKGDTITIEFKSSMSTGKSTFRVTAKNIVGKAKVHKATLQNVKNPRSVKFFLYKRGNKVSLAQGDMAASVVKYTVEGVELDEEVFYWYIIKGNTEKGKVAHVGTERELKLKIRKPTFPPNHVLLKSRKDLKIGDNWKGSMGVSEEVTIGDVLDQIVEDAELEEGTVLQITDVDQWTTEIYKGINAGWKSVAKSTLGGDENVAILIKLTLEPEKDWPHKILQNATYGMIRIATDGTMEMFASDRRVKNMRKTKVKSAKDVVSKINVWIKKAS